MNAGSAETAQQSLGEVRGHRARSTVIVATYLLSVTYMVVAVLAAVPAWANMITVTNPADETGGPSCTLRDAIAAANTDAETGGCAAGGGADTIVFVLPLPTIITLTSNTELAVGSDVTIVGPGADQLAIDGNHATRIFEVTVGATLTLSGLTIQNGAAPPAALLPFGGGVLINSEAMLGAAAATLTDCTLTGNSPDGLTNYLGTVTLTGCTVTANNGRGVVSSQGTALLTSCTVSNNTGGGVSQGGGGSITLRDCT